MQTQQLRFGPGPFDRLTLWQPQTPATATIFVLHGLTEYIGRYEAFAGYMAARGIAVAGFDIPGHGDACLVADGLPRPGYCGPEGSWRDITAMLDRALRWLAARPNAQPLMLMGFSLGSFIARAWLAQQAAQNAPLPICRLLLVGTGNQPAWQLLPVRAVVRRECRRHGEYTATPLVQSIAFGSYNRQIPHAASPYAWLLAGPGALAAYEQDGKVCKSISAGLFRELLSCMIYVSRHEPARCAVPAAFLSGQNDPVGQMGKGVRRAAARFGGAPVVLLPGRHDILHDTGCQQAFAAVLQLLALA